MIQPGGIIDILFQLFIPKFNTIISTVSLCMKKANKLVHETSPYLLQHAYNPVDWHPWGQEALEKAKKENKLIIVSIGYSACHWCHVMEHETFEDTRAARVMNENFVCIKVDREERPDIDTVYMTAVQMITGGGGWPLNCFALPNGKPFYGGTYFRKNDWVNMLEALADAWIEDPEKMIHHAEDLSNGIVQHENVVSESHDGIINKDDISIIVNRLVAYYDLKEGGTRGAPKFPLPVHYEFFLHYWWSEKFQPALEITTISLDKMAQGGIYDHLGGGFSRYSVDEKWHIPHFEKMLYDNAQLISLYSKAFLVSGKIHYNEVVRETIGFIRNELLSPEGGFYSALDADSEGIEGKFYVWQESEVDKILGKDARVFKKYYNVSTPGNWEETNILHNNFSREKFAEYESINVLELSGILDNCRVKLLAVRNSRIKPGLDDKIITSWNGLMIKSLCDAFKAFNVEEYRQMAIKAAEFAEVKLMKEDFSLFRTWKNSRGKINAFLDDYAMLIDAYISLYEIDFAEKYLTIAGGLIEYVVNHFFNPSNGLFYYTSDLDDQIVTRTTELSDNVIPSSNSVMAFNLFRYGHIMGNMNYITMSEKMARTMIPAVSRSPVNYMNWLLFFQTLSEPFYELVITGPDAFKYTAGFYKFFHPALVISAAQEESNLPLLTDRFRPEKILFYVCQNHQCDLPVEDFNLAMSRIQKTD